VSLFFQGCDISSGGGGGGVGGGGGSSSSTSSSSIHVYVSVVGFHYPNDDTTDTFS
jgi:hypothetical protein